MYAPCKDRKELGKIETEYIILYSEKYGDSLLNKKRSPLNKKQKEIIKREADIEDEDKLRIRLELEKEIKIKENNGMYVIDRIIKGRRVATKSRFNEHSKETAYEQIYKKKEYRNRFLVQFD